MAVPWTYENAAHLLRRAAFGGTPAQIQSFHDRHPDVGSAADELLSFKPSKKKPPGARDNTDDNRLRMQAWWLNLMINEDPRDAAREKLVLFWHNHLVSGASKQPTLAYMAAQNGLFRFHARGNFRTLVREFNRDAANLYYLDGITNVASTDGVHVNANENFSRELMELFLYGVFQFDANGAPDPTRPNYTEGDVHQLARALTGWTSVQGAVGLWNPDDWDGGRYDDDGDDAPDDVTIFGVTNNNFRIDAGVAGSPDDVLELLFSRADSEGRSQVGVFLSRKLWTWYAHAAPAPGLKAVLNGLADLFAGSGFELTPLLRAIWTHDEFYSPRAKTRTVRNPADYVVQSLRALGVRSNGKRLPTANQDLGDQLTLMNMNLFEPPNVSGWPGGLAWINVGTLLTRAEFARDVAADESKPALDLRRIPGLIGSAAADPGAVVDTILAQLGLNAAPVGLIPPSSPVPLSAAQRQRLIDYATNNGTKPTLNLSSHTTQDARVKVRGLVALALQAAEHHIF